jgi:acetyltransferase-like isoleucine patch superfamily enzyme
VRIGDFSIIAGVGSQIWTHGYVHEIEGAGRYRVDGEVRIGANVYVGSRCVVTAGVRIGNGTMVGAGATVSGNLDPHAFYVSAPLRKLPRPGDPAGRADLTVVGEPALVETVYSKHLAP